MINPVYVEYYPHEGADCYKIDLPWSEYHKHTLVLGRVDAGYEEAAAAAKTALSEHLEQALARPVSGT